MREDGGLAAATREMLTDGCGEHNRLSRTGRSDTKRIAVLIERSKAALNE
jgi:hypothetical protein